MEGGSAAAFVEQKWHGLLNLLEGRGGGGGLGFKRRAFSTLGNSSACELQMGRLEIE